MLTIFIAVVKDLREIHTSFILLSFEYNLKKLLFWNL